MAHDVFICHASEDKEVAGAACLRLERAGIRCWIAPRDPVPGIPYARQLIDAITESRLVLLVFSEHANRSEHVLRELEIASNAEKTIFPMRIAGVLPSGDLRYYITRLHWFDAIEPPIGDRLDELTARVADLLGAGPISLAPAPVVGKPAHVKLPLQLTSFVAREGDVAAIAGLVRKGRLVTISGAGGVGKTRCAVEVSRLLIEEFPDGAWFVDLSSVHDSGEILTAVATTAGVPISGGEAIEPVLLAYLGKHRSLLILDNCEHVVAPVREFAGNVARNCDSVAILATSREALNIYGEQLYRLASLEPRAAIALFSERAAASDARFALSEENEAYVAEICRRLDGIPLAIELAAARIRMLSAQQLASRLTEKIGNLGGRQNAPRQQTLGATVEWSYELLSEHERVLFRRLGIFTGTFTVDLASAVCQSAEMPPDLVVELFESLLDKSLIQPETISGEMRYRLLEAVREFASEKLDSASETPAMARAHAYAYAEFAQSAYPDWGLPQDDAWMSNAASDLANFRRALRWAFQDGGDPLPGMRIAAAIRSIWMRFDLSEGRRWVEEALTRVGAETPIEVTARLHLAKAHLSVVLGDYRAALPAARRAMELFGETGDAFGTAEAQLFAGGACAMLGDVAEADDLLNRALRTFRELRADRQTGSALQYLAVAHLTAGSGAKARPLFAEALEVFRTTPGAERSARHMAAALAELEFESGDAAAAIALVREALEKDRASRDDVLVVFDLCNISAYLIAQQRYDEGAAAAWEAFELARRFNVEIGVAVALQHLAAVEALQDSDDTGGREALEQAARSIGFLDRWFETSGARRYYTEQQEYEKASGRLSSLLGAEQFETCRAQGAEWTEAEAAAAASKTARTRRGTAESV
ncbi:MAG TPA: TIR domain-containing protein [Candidatus Baltobacteraceae bacterium]|nr:TIR domain-containing protein [Candidatus Baltobacteraceae bacterium]